MKIHKSHELLLHTIHDLRLADLELLRSLLIRERFGFHAVRWTTEVLLKKGFIYRLWKHRNPKFRMDWGSARQVFLLSKMGAEAIGLAPAAGKLADKWFTYLKDPRKEYVLEHELMIARFHAAALKSGLEEWHQGQGTRIDAHGFRLTPDAFFKLKGKFYFLEADTGNERIDSDDATRRTIIGKLRRYAIARQDHIPHEQFKIPGFSVVFLTPQDSPGRAKNLRSAFIGAQQHYRVRPDFFLLVTENDVFHTLQTGEVLTVFQDHARVTESTVARSSLPFLTDAPTHERNER